MDFFSVKFVSHTNFEDIKTTKYVKFGQCNFCKSIDSLCMSHHHCIKPTTSTWATCCGSKLMPNRSHVCARFII